MSIFVLIFTGGLFFGVAPVAAILPFIADAAPAAIVIVEKTTMPTDGNNAAKAPPNPTMVAVAND